MSPTAKRPCLRHRIPKMIQTGESGNSGRFLFSSLFLLCYLLLQKLAKSLISLSDCPFGLYRPPCFY
jgi:hypothetical protein